MHHISPCSCEPFLVPEVCLGCGPVLCGLALHSSSRAATCPLLRCEPSFHPHCSIVSSVCASSQPFMSSLQGSQFPGRRRRCPWLVAGALCCPMSLPQPLTQRVSTVSPSPPLGCCLTSRACAECCSDPSECDV